MPVSFAKLAGDFHRSRKIRKAGRNGREVFLWVLCQNALHDRDGWIPLADLDDTAYVSDELQCDVRDVRDGVTAARDADLIRIDGDRVIIVGWDEDWSRRALTDAERSAKYRNRLKENRDASRDVTDASRPRDASRKSRMRGEEKRREEKREDQNPDCAAAPVEPEPVPVRRVAKGTEPAIDAPDHARVVDHWDTRYRAANNGAGPTWNPKNGKLLSTLRKQHGADEVIRRMDLLFDGHGPSWISVTGCDVGQFAAHFDKLAAKAQPQLAIVPPRPISRKLT